MCNTLKKQRDQSTHRPGRLAREPDAGLEVRFQPCHNGDQVLSPLNAMGRESFAKWNSTRQFKCPFRIFNLYLKRVLRVKLSIYRQCTGMPTEAVPSVTRFFLKSIDVRKNFQLLFSLYDSVLAPHQTKLEVPITRLSNSFAGSSRL